MRCAHGRLGQGTPRTWGRKWGRARGAKSPGPRARAHRFEAQQPPLEEVAAEDQLQPTEWAVCAVGTHSATYRVERVKEVGVQHAHLIDEQGMRATPALARSRIRGDFVNEFGDGSLAEAEARP